MKTIHALFGLAGLLLFSGCATPKHQPANHPPEARAVPANFLVIAAVYGSGTQYADVTYRVNELLHQPGVEFFARPEWLRADPTPGWNKALVIVYELNGVRRIFSTGEGGKVSAPQLMNKPEPKQKNHRAPKNRQT